MSKNYAFYIIFILFSISFIYAETSSSTINWASKRYVDNNFCMLEGNCEFGELTLDNLILNGNITFIGDIKNVTIINQIVNGTLTVDGNLDVINLSVVDSVILNGIRLTNLTPNSNIDGDVYGIMMTNPPNQELPHFILQSGGFSQASVILRSLMIANEINDFHNTTDRTDCSKYMTYIGEELKIDCNTTTTGADLIVSDDSQFVDEVWMTDTDGEWHFMTRELELLDELKDETLVSRINSTLIGDSLTIYDRQNKTLVVNINENNIILDRKQENINLTEGTNASPNFIHVYYDTVGAPILTQSLTAQDDKADVAQILMGGNYSYGDVISSAQQYEFTRGVYHRFFNDGAIYINGFDVNASSTDINVSNGTMQVMLDSTTSTNLISTDVLYHHVHSDGTYHQHSNLNGLDQYSTGESIGNNKYFNVVFDLCHSSSNVFTMQGIIQSKPTVEYTSSINAEIDSQNTVNLFPSNSFMKKICIPIARTVMKNSGGTNTIQTLSNGQLFFDLRGTATSSGGSAPTPGITSHSDLTNLAYSVAGHTGDLEVDGFINATNINASNQVCDSNGCIGDTGTGFNITDGNVSYYLDQEVFTWKYD